MPIIDSQCRKDAAERIAQATRSSVQYNRKQVPAMTNSVASAAEPDEMHHATLVADERKLRPTYKWAVRVLFATITIAIVDALFVVIAHTAGAISPRESLIFVAAFTMLTVITLCLYLSLLALHLQPRYWSQVEDK